MPSVHGPDRMINGLAATPQPPYYAVIFTSRRGSDTAGYGAMADEMERLAATQDGYLGHESARGADGLGITVSYWRDEASIASWKSQSRHRLAQKLGHERWYEVFSVRVARVERAYAGPTPDHRRSKD